MVDSMATVDTLLPTLTLMAMDTHQLTDMALTGFTSVRLMLSQRLMPTTPMLTDMDTHHTDTLPHTATDMATAAQLTVMDTTIKLLPTIP